MTTLHHITNVPYQTVRHGRITIQGASRALVHSCWRIPEWDVGFDLGAMPWEFLATPTWFISHAHIDHLAALPVLVSRRNIMEMAPPTAIYLPETNLDAALEMLKVWERLDQGPQNCRLIGLTPGEEVPLGKDHVVTTIATTHAVPSLGYVVWETRRKLKPEFQGFSGDQLRQLRESGTEVTAEIRLPMVCYTGDTSPGGFDANPVVYEAKVLITEMTVLKPTTSLEKIHGFGHMHISDFATRADRFQNELVIAAHISSRNTREEAERFFAEGLPAELLAKSMLWM